MPGYPCCCDPCRCLCGSCTGKAPPRYKVVLSGLAGATAADLDPDHLNCTTDINGNWQADPIFETEADNIKPCGDCGSLNGTYIFYHGGSDTPPCGYMEYGEPVAHDMICWWKPLTLPTSCDVDVMRLEVKNAWVLVDGEYEQRGDYFQLKIGFENFCQLGGSDDFADCNGEPWPEEEEVFYSSYLYFEGWLGDYTGKTCCNIVDFVPGNVYQDTQGGTIYDASGDCLTIIGPDKGYRRKCSARGVTDAVKITALEAA